MRSKGSRKRASGNLSICIAMLEWSERYIYFRASVLMAEDINRSRHYISSSGICGRSEIHVYSLSTNRVAAPRLSEQHTGHTGIAANAKFIKTRVFANDVS